MVTIKIINYEPKDVWDFFQKEKSYLRTGIKQIAEYPEIGVVISITCEIEKGNELPEIIVYIDDNEFYTEVAVNKNDCEQTVKKIYYEYLDEERMIDRFIGAEPDKDNKWSKEEMEIDDREEDLHMAVKDVLEWFVGEPIDEFVGKNETENITEDIIEDLMNHISEYLYLKWGISIYRPMILEDEDGEEFYEEHPYECMVFDEKELQLYDK